MLSCEVSDSRDLMNFSDFSPGQKHIHAKTHQGPQVTIYFPHLLTSDKQMTKWKAERGKSAFPSHIICIAGGKKEFYKQTPTLNDLTTKIMVFHVLLRRIFIFKLDRIVRRRTR